jgi:hypothetical protein
MALSDISKRVVCVNEDGSIGILIPTPEYLENHTIEDLIAKDIPPGIQYYIIDASEMPTDRTFRNAWTWE